MRKARCDSCHSGVRFQVLGAGLGGQKLGGGKWSNASSSVADGFCTYHLQNRGYGTLTSQGESAPKVETLNGYTLIYADPRKM